MPARCYDQWSVDFPGEEFLIGGHSCWRKHQAGTCEAVLEVCAATCGLCSEDGISLADALDHRLVYEGFAFPRRSCQMIIISGKQLLVIIICNYK